MKYFFTSDLHLYHTNIIKYCKRPFISYQDMNKTLISNWNARVKEDDIVFHNGDFMFRNSAGGKKGEGEPVKFHEVEKLLNGRIIHIKGNHDRNNSTKTIVERLVIRYGNHRVNIVHDPKFADYNYKINFVGHIHNLWSIQRFTKGSKHTDCINIGVDVNNFRPVTFEELMKKYHAWKKKNNYK